MPPDLRGFVFRLAAQAEDVPIARRAVRLLLRTAGVAESRITDVTLAVSEACANAVVHASPDRTGMFEIEAAIRGNELFVVVRDEGSWSAPRLDAPRLGLQVVGAIADRLQIDARRDAGSDVRMVFALRGPRHA
jgi:serine/threonine-protein kinase RsbW